MKRLDDLTGMATFAAMIGVTWLWYTPDLSIGEFIALLFLGALLWWLFVVWLLSKPERTGWR